MKYTTSNIPYFNFITVIFTQILSIVVVTYSGFASDTVREILLVALLAISAYFAIKICTSRMVTISMSFLWLGQLAIQYIYASSLSLWFEKLVFEYKYDSILVFPTTNSNPSILFDCILIPGTLSVILQFVLILILLMVSLLVQKRIKRKVPSILVGVAIVFFSAILVQPSYVVETETSGCSTAIGQICMSGCTYKGLMLFGVKTNYIIGVSCWRV